MDDSIEYVAQETARSLVPAARVALCELFAKGGIPAQVADLVERPADMPVTMWRAVWVRVAEILEAEAVS